MLESMAETKDVSVGMRISNLVVQTTSACTGRGPTRAKTSIDTDLITVVLRDTLTKGERTLVEQGQAELVLAMRRAYQQTMRDELVAGVERLTGRQVVAFLSGHHAEPDIAIESFVLAPAED